MSTRDLVDALKQHMGAMQSQIGQPRHAAVSSFDPVNWLAKVTFHPGDEPSAWLPVAVPNGGNGWGVLSGLAPGQQVLVIFDNGDAEHGIVIGATFSTLAAPPSIPSAPGGAATPIQSGETALVHQSGQFIRLCKDGSICSQGTWKHSGDFNATGEVTRGYQTGDQVTLGHHDHTYTPGSGSPAPTSAPVAGT